MNIRILNRDDVRSALPMSMAIDIMKKAFGQYSSGNTTMPLRSRVENPQGVTLLMPAHLHESGDFAIKIVSVYGRNPELGLPTIAAAVLILDPDTGIPQALLEGDSLTAIRTGAAGGLAADILARKDSKTVALFGTGIQGRAQLEAVMCVRKIRQVHLFDVSPDSAQNLADEISRMPDSPRISVSRDPEAAVTDADIILAATTSRTPVFSGQHLKPGTHITGVGSYTPEMQEIDEITVQQARVIVDSRESCTHETGDIMIPKAEIYAELGEIINGDKPGRKSDREITFFKSVGIAAQDAAAAGAVFKEAIRKNLGTLVELS